jgi:hypothetical protein
MTTDLVFATTADVCRLPCAFRRSIESRLAHILCSLSLSNRPATYLQTAGPPIGVFVRVLLVASLLATRSHYPFFLDIHFPDRY